ncbi:MAG: PD-(D/E)XK nuclease family protein [Candidatus Pacebacteria bacterium]|nr:PD-(D/E)XK nuclease family protein [Candidatus Paceibacterota bacterium]
MAIKVSATKLLTFTKCPWKYFLIYECKPRIEVPISIWLVFGQAVHQLIASFYRLSPAQMAQRIKRGKTILYPTTKEKAIRMWHTLFSDVLKEKNAEFFHSPCRIRFDRSTPKGIKEEKEKFRALGASMIGKYWKDNKDAPPPIAVEAPFSKIPAPDVEEKQRYDVVLVGTMDQIREIPYQGGQGKNWYILDLKTSWYDFGEEDPRVQFPVHRDLQFTIYSWAFRVKYGRKEGGIIRYPLGYRGKNPITGEKIDKRALITPREDIHFLELGQLIDFFLSCQKREDFSRIIGKHCERCDYLEICAHPELIIAKPIPVSEFDWGEVDSEIIKKRLEEAAPLRKFSQPRLF